MKTMENQEMTDAELDSLLSAATVINVPLGAQSRLLQNLPPRKPAATRASFWKAAVPLAASLMLGVYLGAGGYGTDFLPAGLSATVETEDADVSTGFEEALDVAESDLS